jgi:hypothetical protein
MSWNSLVVGVMAAVAVFTWTTSGRADDTERGPNDVRTLTLGADGNADTLPVQFRGGPGFVRAPRFDNRSSFARFNRFDNRFAFSRFNRVDGRFAFSRFNRFDNRFSFARFNRFDNRFAFRRFDRIEDRRENRFRFANPSLFRRLDRIEDRRENRFRFGRFTPIADRAENGPANFAYRAYGEPESSVVPPAAAPPENLRVKVPAKPVKFVYRAYGE